jgi:hypothetical protein
MPCSTCHYFMPNYEDSVSECSLARSMDGKPRHKSPMFYAWIPKLSVLDS